MIDIQSTELILRVTGEVQASNIKEFETQALLYIDQIKTELVTDQDFAEAKQVVKSCKVAEDRIANALQQAVMSMETVAEVKAIAEKLQVKLRDTRLMLDKKVKTEEVLRKNEIVNAGIKKVTDHLEESQVQHAFSVDIAAIKDATKNKRSLDSMRESVTAVADEQIVKINDMETLYLENFVTIQKTEAEYPGLFPDAKRIAVSSAEVVEAQISSRVNKYLFDMQQKKEAERVAKEETERKEAERIAREKAEKEVKEDTALLEPPSFAQQEEEPEPPSFANTEYSDPEPPSFTTQSEPEQTTIDLRVKEVTVMVRITASDKERIIQEIRSIAGVSFVTSGS
jgi:hypothetical protein